ncbi:glutamate-gated chloride channel alpha-like [Penaeus monodon]|uniref:glutamate-gated chloride channel alpha-like n=1 Tax=Penaeus monodon TaxID=6687 RepID=UPI0018A714D2|nr:glutamate-gated chloride channel alpha-like [Penaeus monodon]
MAYLSINLLMKTLQQVEFTLKRRFERIVLELFLPSFMLVAIGYATLFIKLSLLQVRLTVSLTTLLVLYTLSNQISKSLPPTSYIKLIDCWFFYCLFLLFLVIIFHVFIERLEETSTSKVIPLCGKSNDPKTRPNMCKTERVLNIVRLFVVPILIIGFNVVLLGVNNRMVLRKR